MATDTQRPLLPLRIGRPVHRGSGPTDLPAVSDRVADDPVAPDRPYATTTNGATQPPGDLHIALVIPHPKMYEYIKDKVFVLTPPYWRGGAVHLHIIPNDPSHRAANVEWLIRQALVDLKLVDPADVGFAPPEQTTFGWNSDE